MWNYYVIGAYKSLSGLQTADDMYKYGEYKHDKKCIDKAIEYYKKALEMNSKHPGALNKIVRALTEKGCFLFNSRKYKEAIEIAEEAIKYDRENTDLFCQLGSAHYQLRQLDDALKYFDKALDISSSNKQAIQGKNDTKIAQCNLLLEQGEYGQVIELIKSLLGADDFNNSKLQLHLLLGKAYYESKKYDDALKSFDNALITGVSKNYSALIGKIKTFHKQKKCKETEQLLNDLFPIDGEWPTCNSDVVEIYIDAAKIFGELKNYICAIKLCEKALETTPNRNDIKSVLCDLQREKQEKDSNDILTYYATGSRFLSDNKFEQAIAWFDKALNLSPDKVNLDSLSGKGWALFCLQRYQEAIEIYTKALDVLPIKATKKALLHYYRGKAQYALGKYQDAITDFDKDLERDADTNKEQKKELLYLKGVSLSNLGKYKESLACLSKAIEIDENFSPALFAKGNVLYKLRDFGSAIDCYDKAYKSEPCLIEACFNKVHALYKLNRYEEAKCCVQEVLGHDKDNEKAKHLSSSLEEEEKTQKLNHLTKFGLYRQGAFSKIKTGGIICSDRLLRKRSSSEVFDDKDLLEKRARHE